MRADWAEAEAEASPCPGPRGDVAVAPEDAPIVIGSRTLTSQLHLRNFMLWVRYGSKIGQ